MITIRHERRSDVSAREALLHVVFGSDRFEKTSERLREGRLPAEGLSFVATRGHCLIRHSPALARFGWPGSTGTPAWPTCGRHAVAQRRYWFRADGTGDSVVAATWPPGDFFGRRRALLCSFRLFHGAYRGAVPARNSRAMPSAWISAGPRVGNQGQRANLRHWRKSAGADEDVRGLAGLPARGARNAACRLILPFRSSGSAAELLCPSG
jgi:hypothetical protein